MDGVNIKEVPTAVKPPAKISAGLAVYFGTAPINSVDLTNVNKPVLCETESDFTAAFGAITHDFADWTLHEAAVAHFEVYGVAPIVCINILDPNNVAHVADVTSELHALVAGQTQLHLYVGNDAPLLGILESTVVVKNQARNHTYALNTDYTLAFDDSGFLVLTTLGNAITATQVLSIDFNYLNPAGIVTNDVIGGYSGGAYKGLAVLEQVFPALRMVPGLVLAPKYSHTPQIAAAMVTAASLINGAFSAMALTDLSTDPNVIATYAAAAAWKTNNGYTSPYQLACWPKVLNGDDVYHTSTVAACVADKTDAANNDVPFASPSNKPIVGTAAVLLDGSQVLLTRAQANVLRDNGIVTVLNGFNGWKLWGSRTACYPGNTDPKDSFIPVRRMFNWIGNTIILTTDNNVDDPITRRLIDLVVGTLTSFLDGLTAQGALVAGKIEFRSDENSATDLSDGKVTWHVTLTPPSPGQELDFTLEYDPSALEALFAST